MSSNQLNQTWNLKLIFSDFNELECFLKQTKILIEKATDTIEKLSIECNQINFNASIEHIQSIESRVIQIREFMTCVLADELEMIKEFTSGFSKINHISLEFTELNNKFINIISKIPHSIWKEILSDKNIQPLNYNLSNLQLQNKIDLNKERLINDLSEDGFFSWSTMYKKLVKHLCIANPESNFKNHLTLGQSLNLMQADDNSIRLQISRNLEKALQTNEELFAETLNHIIGFRLKSNEHRDIKTVLDTALKSNRISKETLDVMWSVIEKNQEKISSYFQYKAKLLNVDQLRWCDIYAPLKSEAANISYTEASETIIKEANKFSPAMSRFISDILEKNWVEATNRKDKPPGAFCANFPFSKESRIFMTFENSLGSLTTLAHELGHAYHFKLINDSPQMNQKIPLTLCETASTFTEHLVLSNIMEEIDDQNKLAILDKKLQNSICFISDVYARFLFEESLYQERKSGFISSTRLNELMLNAQKKAFNNQLNEYHPYLWITKSHFYSTRVPFYNFPYAFGHLFSIGILALAEEDVLRFSVEWESFLKNSGRMEVEELTEQHFGINIRKVDFWQTAFDVILSDLEEFENLSEKLHPSL